MHYALDRERRRRGDYASCITHTSDASLAMGVRGELTSHVLRTRTTDLTEKWRPARVTPHVLRIRFTHSHAQGVGEGLRTTYYAHAFRIRVRSGGRRGLRLTHYAYVLRICTPKVSERAYAPRITHTYYASPPQPPLCARTGAAARAAISWR